MEKVRVLYDAFGRTLCIWIGDPQSEVACEEIGDDTILMKDGQGHIIGLEKLNVAPPEAGLGITVELMPGSTQSG